ncbi:MAG: hypothetical protein J0M16_08280 [Gammaproteobacteria bacterium]|nr:hypothetical protein [Gammaproteobacteria bacterium]
MDEPCPESQPEPRGPELPGEPLRRRHGLHFNDCEAVGRHSPLYFAYFCRDLTPYLLAALRELETRAAMVLAGEPRRRVLALLYDWQDDAAERLPAYFIQCSDAISPWQLGFGHVGCGHMGITDPELWERQVDGFRENVWATVVKQGRRNVRRSPGP